SRLERPSPSPLFPYTTLFRSAGYQVVTAADGQEALDVLRHQGPSIDLVLSDLVMPRLGGRALYDALRREGRTARFLFASGYSDPDRRGGARLDPALPFLHKPWTANDLLLRIRAVLDEDSLLPSPRPTPL